MDRFSIFMQQFIGILLFIKKHIMYIFFCVSIDLQINSKALLHSCLYIERKYIKTLKLFFFLVCMCEIERKILNILALVSSTIFTCIKPTSNLSYQLELLEEDLEGLKVFKCRTSLEYFLFSLTRHSLHDSKTQKLHSKKFPRQNE